MSDPARQMDGQLPPKLGHQEPTRRVVPLEGRLRWLRAITTRVPRYRIAGLLHLVLIFMLLWINRGRRWSGLQTLVEADVLGFRMQLDPLDYVECAELLIPQLYDVEELRFMQRALHSGEVFVDVGAHLGLYSLVAARIVGDGGAVLAIEAEPVTFERLHATLNRNGATNVRPLQVGVSDYAGVLRFGIAPRPLRAASSFLRATEQDLEVTCRPLLDIVRHAGVTRINGMKLDIEGYEFRVLARFLDDAPLHLRPGFVIVEHHRNMVQQAGGNVIDLLRHRGYELRGRYGVNCIFVRIASG